MINLIFRLIYVHFIGAFLIPYGIMLILVGIPIFFMELSIGQYSQEGPLKVWENIFPLLKGWSFALLMTLYVRVMTVN